MIAGALGPRRVLLVDDDRMLLDGMLRGLRYLLGETEIVTAESFDEACQLIKRIGVDAVISDINMPGKNGFALLERIREISPDLPVVFVTGLADRDLKRKALEAGATDLLSKPIDVDDLVARIRSVLRLKAAQDEAKAYREDLERRVVERTREVEVSRREMILRLALAAELRDEQTGRHIIRVAGNAQIVCEELGLSPEFTEMVFLAAPLHDVGKIGVPDRILFKPGKLDPDEFEEIKKHCEIGRRILSTSMNGIPGVSAGAVPSLEASSTPTLLSIAESIAYGHHEKWDGSGYPQGLSGEQIPIEARIVAVSDVFDALCSARPYKAALTPMDALSLMRGNVGSHFDPTVFEAFERGFDRVLALLDEADLAHHQRAA